MKTVTFEGAELSLSDDINHPFNYTPRGAITINLDRIDAYYDHTILVGGHKIRVMDTFDEIRQKINSCDKCY